MSQSEPTPLGYLSGFGRWHAARSFWLLRIVYTCFQIKWIVDFHSFPYMLAIYSSLLPMSQQPRRPRSRGKHKQNKKLSAASKLGLAQLSKARSPKRPGVQSGATGEKMYLPVSSNVAMGSTYKCFFWKITYKWSISVAMFDYRRVKMCIFASSTIPLTCGFGKYVKYGKRSWTSMVHVLKGRISHGWIHQVGNHLNSLVYLWVGNC